MSDAKIGAQGPTGATVRVAALPMSGPEGAVGQTTGPARSLTPEGAVGRTGGGRPMPKGQLEESKLYFGDNGQVFCGTLACAGATAYFSARTISGQRVELLTEESNAFFIKAIGKPACCESCKKEF